MSRPLPKIFSTKILAPLAMMILISGCGPTQKVQRTLALNRLSFEARSAEKNGDDQQALELWEEYVIRRPQEPFAQYQLGLTETRLGMYQRAIGHLTTAHDLRPGNVEYIEALAEVYLLTDRPEDMMSLMRQTSGEGGLVAGHLRLARYAQRVGLLDEAKGAIRSAMIFGNGESAEPYMAMADLARLAGDAALEEKSLRQALWFDRGSDALDQRFLALGITPGPSLAMVPTSD